MDFSKAYEFCIKNGRPEIIKLEKKYYSDFKNMLNFPTLIY